MANMKYFADLNGETVELAKVRHDGSVFSSAKHFAGFTADGALVQCTRVIEYKPRPSKHECDDRCIHATGRVMKCECSCGGKNHGKGH